MKTFRIIGMVLMAIVMGVSFVSCNPDDKQEEPTKKLVKFGHGNNETILKYDEQGHLIEYSDVMGLEGLTKTYTYTYVWGENTIDITLDVNGGESQEKCTLDLANGLASGISENPLTFHSSFKYNSSNRLIETESFMGTRSLEWNDDKLIAKHDSFSIATNNDTYAYDKNYTTKGYNPLIPYVTTTDLLYVAHPELAGLATEKLYNSETSNKTLGNKEYTFAYKYTYEFNEDGYVTKAIVTGINEENEEYKVNEYTFVWE